MPYKDKDKQREYNRERMRRERAKEKEGKMKPWGQFIPDKSIETNESMSKISKEFAISEMRKHGDKIREWAQQSDNLLLKSLASEVLVVAGAKS